MTTLKTICPFCKNQVAAVLINEVALTQKYTGAAPRFPLYTVILQCPFCSQLLLTQVEGINSSSGTPKSFAFDIASRFHVIEQWPKYQSPTSDPAIPAEVGKHFIEAKENILSKRWDSAGLMSRKTLEVTLKLIAPDLEGKLCARIDKLEEQRRIPPLLKDWAHEIRLIGNDAAHEIEPITSKDATDAVNFTEIFLEYIFIMPAQIAARKNIEKVSA